MDTVFPEGTDVTVKRQGTRLLAPGVGDNTRSLAVFLAMLRAMDEARIETTTDILFVGNVGEEGLGDLRGVKYLLQKGKYKDRIKQFLAVDGAGTGENIANGAVGSKRYRVDVQRTRRPQLFGFRTRESRVRDGRSDAEVRRHHRAALAKDNVLGGRGRRRHLGQLDSVRDLDGSGHADPNRRSSSRSSRRSS